MDPETDHAMQTLIYDKSGTAEQERMVLGKLGIYMKNKRKKEI